MPELFKIRVAKDHLSFCSGHFISYEGSKCERLHGHNYRAGVEVEGVLTENHYVFDFILLKKITKVITEELDHRMLLPTRNQFIHVSQEGSSVDVRYEDRHWRFPVGDCVLLPIENTTAELLSRYICQKVRSALVEQYQFKPRLLCVEVEETPGQSATYEWTASD